jgi:hypothetical protein
LAMDSTQLALSDPRVMACRPSAGRVASQESKRMKSAMDSASSIAMTRA